MRGDDAEREARVASQKMAVFTDQQVSANPLGIAGDEGISRLKALLLVLMAERKGDDIILVNLAESRHHAEEFPCRLRRQMSQRFSDDGSGDADRMTGTLTDQLLEELLTRGLWEKTKGEDKLVGVKDEQQTSDPTAPPAPNGYARWLQLRTGQPAGNPSVPRGRGYAPNSPAPGDDVPLLTACEQPSSSDHLPFSAYLGSGGVSS